MSLDTNRFVCIVASRRLVGRWKTSQRQTGFHRRNRVPSRFPSVRNHLLGRHEPLIQHSSSIMS